MASAMATGAPVVDGFLELLPGVWLERGAIHPSRSGRSLLIEPRALKTHPQQPGRQFYPSPEIAEAFARLTGWNMALRLGNVRADGWTMAHAEFTSLDHVPTWSKDPEGCFWAEALPSPRLDPGLAVHRNPLTLAPTATQVDEAAHQRGREAPYSLNVTSKPSLSLVKEPPPGGSSRARLFKIREVAKMAERVPPSIDVLVYMSGTAPRTADALLKRLVKHGWSLAGVGWHHDHHGRLAWLVFRTPAGGS